MVADLGFSEQSRIYAIHENILEHDIANIADRSGQTAT